MLEGVEHGVVHGSLGGVAAGKGDGSDVLDTDTEGSKDGLGGNGENGSGVQFAVVKDVLDVHLVLERSDLELVEEGSLTGGDLLVSLDDQDFGDDLDLTLDNLGGDVQVLEEGGLLGVHTGGAGGDGHISGGEDTNLGGGLSDLGVKNFLDVSEVTVGEDHAGVELELFLDNSEVGADGLLLAFILINKLLDGGFHEGLKKESVKCRVDLRSCP